MPTTMGATRKKRVRATAMRPPCLDPEAWSPRERLAEKLGTTGGHGDDSGHELQWGSPIAVLGREEIAIVKRK